MPAYPQKGIGMVKVCFIWRQMSDTYHSGPLQPHCPKPVPLLVFSISGCKTLLIHHFFLAANPGVVPPLPQSWWCCFQNIALSSPLLCCHSCWSCGPASPAQGLPTVVPFLPLSNTGLSQQPEGSIYGVNHFVSLPYIEPCNGDCQRPSYCYRNLGETLLGQFQALKFWHRKVK